MKPRMSPTDAIRPSVSLPTRARKGSGVASRRAPWRSGTAVARCNSRLTPSGSPSWSTTIWRCAPKCHELEQEGHETAVPRGQCCGIKRHALDAWGVIDRLFHVGERGKLVLQPPAAGEFDQHRLCRRATAVQLSATAWLVRYAMHRSSFRRDIGMLYPPRRGTLHGTATETHGHIVGQFYAACPVNNDAFVILEQGGATDIPHRSYHLKRDPIEWSGSRTPVSNYRPNACAV